MTPLALLLLDTAPAWVLPGAIVDLDLANGRGWAQQGGGLLDLISTTRASTGYAQTSSGSLTLFQANIPRITDLGLLVEEARTNLALRSQAFDNASWAKAAIVTVTADTTVAPDGTTTADTLTGGANGSSNYWINQPITIVSGSTYTYSAYVKPGTSNFVSINVAISAGNFFAAAFDLTSPGSAASQTAVGGTSGTIVSSGSALSANGFVRIWLTGSVTGTSAFFEIQQAAGATGNTFSTSGDITNAPQSKTIILWGAQLELGSFPTSYIPTTTVSVTRAADSITSSTVSFPAPYSAVISMAGLPAVAAIDLLEWGSLVNGGGFTMQSTGGVFVRESSSTTANVGSGSLSAGTAFKVGGRFAVNDTNSVTNGTAGTHDTSVTPPTMTQFAFGPALFSFNGGTPNGYFRRVTFFKSGLTDAQLQALTQ